MSPSPSRLWSRAIGRASASVPSQMRDQARLRPLEPLLDDHGAPIRVAASIAASTSPGDDATVTPLPPARPSALTTTPRPTDRAPGRTTGHSPLCRCRGRRAPSGRRPRRRPHGRTPCSTSMRAAAGRRPEDRDPRRRERVGDAGRERRLRPDDDELGGHGPASATTAAPDQRVDLAQVAHTRLAGDGRRCRARR